MRRLVWVLIMSFLAAALVFGCGKTEEPKAKKTAEQAVSGQKEGEKKEAEKKEPEKKETPEVAKPKETKPKDTQPGEAKPAAEKPSEEKKSDFGALRGRPELVGWKARSRIFLALSRKTPSCRALMTFREGNQYRQR